MADDSGRSGTLKSLKDRWRSKSNADRSAGSVPQDVSDFLRPQSNASNNRPAPPLAPKIDIAAAQRWAGNSADLRSANGGIATPSSLRGRGGSQKKPRRPNMRVGFDDILEVMGEGGEECEEPTSEISLAKQRNASRSGPHLNRKPVGAERSDENRPHTQPMRASPPRPDYASNAPTLDAQDQYSTSKDAKKLVTNAAQADAYRSLFGEEPDDQPVAKPKLDNDDNFRPPPLRRAATGFSARESISSHYSDEGSADGSPTVPQAMTDSASNYRLPEINSHDSPLDFGFNEPKSAESNHSAHLPARMQSKIQRMRQEEGRILHQNARRSIVDLAEENIISPQKEASQDSRSNETDESDIYDMYQTSGQAAARRSPVKVRNPPPAFNTMGPAGREPRLPVMQSYQEPPRGNSSTSPPNTTSGNMDLYNRPQQQTMPYRPPPSSAPSQPPPSDVSPLSPVSSSTAKPSPSPLAIPSKDYQSTIPRNADLYAAAARQQADTRALSRAASARTPGAALAMVAWDEFGRRCSHMKGIFRLQAEFEKPMSEYTATQWLRAAAWWFVKGRSGLEQLIRSRPRTTDGANGAKEELLSQPHVDLAKCWWILSEVVASHESLPPPMSADMSFAARATAAATTKDIEASEFFESCEILHANLKALLTSMNKNNLMPPNNALIQGQDQTIWIPYPQFSSDLLPVLTGKSRSLTQNDSSVRVFNPMSVMAVADTNNEFSYYKWFVKVSLGNGDEDSEQVSLLCLFSVMRPRNEWHPKIAICTQKELVTIVVTGDRKLGPSWEDVKWSESDTSLQIKLPHGYIMNAQLNPQDYQILVSMYKKAYTVQTSLFPLEDEQVAYQAQLADFQYNDTMRPPAFPLERQRRCRVRLHMKYETFADGNGARKVYRGMRVLVTSSPKSRTLGNTSHELGVGSPVVIEMLTENTPGGESFPAMAIHYKEPHRQCTMFMVFAQLKDRQDLYSALNQADVAPEEMQYAGLRLRKLNIEPIGDYDGKGLQNPLGRINWSELVILNKDPFNPDDDFGQTVASDSLRIVAHGAGGSITDRINIGPGELRICVNADGTPGISVLRQPQEDMTLTLDRRAAPFTLEQAEELFLATQALPTRRTYLFYNADDLHAFQKSITAFSVKFDGLARSFTISRRRPMTALSKHKKLEANLTRIQVVSHDQDKIVQLLAFFDSNDFPYAESLGFVLKGVDVFERYDGSKMGSARCGVRIVDAKFSLPKEKTHKARPEDIERPYVCLDMPDYPAENDDIWIGFDEEEERERFLRALPAPATSHSRGMGGVFGKR